MTTAQAKKQETVEVKESSKKEMKQAKIVKLNSPSNKLDCFGSRIDSDTHKFVMHIAKSPCTMKDIKSCTWNKRPNTFYCKHNMLKEQGLAAKSKAGLLSLTAKGKKMLDSWKQEKKTEKKAEKKKA